MTMNGGIAFQPLNKVVFEMLTLNITKLFFKFLTYSPARNPADFEHNCRLRIVLGFYFNTFQWRQAISMKWTNRKTCFHCQLMIKRRQFILCFINKLSNRVLNTDMATFTAMFKRIINACISERHRYCQHSFCVSTVAPLF